MKRFAIVFLNIIIFIALAAGILVYTDDQKRAHREQAEQNLAGTTQLICGIADNYFTETEGVCSTWASYINDSSMTMREAVRYLSAVRISDDVYAQIVWADDLTGLSRESYLSDPDRRDVSYAGRASLFSGWTDPTALFVTPRFTNPVTGTYAVAFCKQVTLLDAGAPRRAIMMRIVPNDYLNARWVFPSNYADAGIAIIDERGRYIIKPVSMKNEDFFGFLYSYNQGTVDQNALEERVRTEESGLILAKDAMGKDRVWSFRRLGSNPGWTVVMSVPLSAVDGEGVDWFLPRVILATLCLLFSVDMLYFLWLRKKDRQVHARLEEQGERLRCALEEAEYANRAKTTFLNNMSHDIRTPMNAILGFTALAQNHLGDTDRVREDLGKIRTSGEHLLSLINDVLDMSRIESGKVEIEEKEASLSAILSDLEGILETDIQRKNLSFTVETEDIVHDRVVCDRLRLTRILSTFCPTRSNSPKAAERSGFASRNATARPKARRISSSACGTTASA
ncbi:MAG: histidine kinase dimerization/phospho-acceptor domain-containing protein [Clostridia bacterium]|nr:histidine kinase dimerization/phospho-acceptor domain-containing protein [Clostridia bacterium]